MKRRIGCLIGVSAILSALGCASPEQSPGTHRGITTISVGGTEGSAVTGHYVQDGYRYAIDETLPFTVQHAGLSEFQIHKLHPEATLAVAAQYNVALSHFETFGHAPGGVSGLNVRVREGVVVEKIRP